jgi:hypothetical protein
LVLVPSCVIISAQLTLAAPVQLLIKLDVWVTYDMVQLTVDMDRGMPQWGVWLPFLL